MPWKSETRQFGLKEIGLIETYSVEQLVQGILFSDPLVALRILAELYLHDDTQRLSEIVARPDLSDHWRGYEFDFDANDEDRVYALNVDRFSSSISKTSND